MVGAEEAAPAAGPLPDAPPPDIDQLDARFGRLAAEYDSRRAAAEAAVTRWEWYARAAFDLEPLYYERHLSRPGRRLARRPPADRDCHQASRDTR